MNAARISNQTEFQNHDLWPVLFDPQTAGGLLISVPRSRAEDCLKMLLATGHDRAAMVGEITKTEEAGTVTLS